MYRRTRLSVFHEINGHDCLAYIEKGSETILHLKKFQSPLMSIIIDHPLSADNFSAKT